MADDVKPYVHTNTKGITYHLHKKDVTLRGGKQQTIYFFCKPENTAKGEPAQLPDGYEVTENPRNYFLTLKKKRTEA